MHLGAESSKCAGEAADALILVEIAGDVLTLTADAGATKDHPATELTGRAFREIARGFGPLTAHCVVNPEACVN